MPLPIPVILAMAAGCAPTTAPKTLAAIVLAESGGDPLAIGVNGAKPHRIWSRDAVEATRIAERLLARGANFDLGLGQINSRNLAPLGLTVSDAFDPCRNLSASARVLAADYSLADPVPGAEQAALRKSLSLYNTGDPQRGFRNGYVAKITAAAQTIVPALSSASDADGRVSPTPPPPPPPAWDVFAQARVSAAGFVFQPQTPGDGR